MDLGLSGKNVLVFGSSSGIGFAIAQKFAEEGSSVTLVARSIDRLQLAKIKILEKNPKTAVHIFQMDLTDQVSVESGFNKLLQLSTPDVVVFNAGGPPAGPILSLTLSDWEKGFQVLQRCFFWMVPQLIDRMMEKSWGRLLFVTSTTSKEIIPRLAVSGVFRAGLTSYVKSLAKEVGRSGILVNNLLPGPTATDRLQELEKKSPDFYHSMQTESGVGRVADPIEIASVAVFLCSTANTYLTGTDVLVDGAYTKAL